MNEVTNLREEVASLKQQLEIERNKRIQLEEKLSSKSHFGDLN